MKIGWGEILLITPMVLFVDFTELWGTMLMTSTGVLIPLLPLLSALGIATAFFVQTYFFFKHVKNYTFLVVSLFDSLPLVSAVPLRTLGWLFTVFMTNNKKVPGVAEDAAAER